jgi:hypothetical protein
MERRDGCRRGKQIQEGQLPGVLGRVEARSSGVGAAGGWLWACPSREFPGVTEVRALLRKNRQPWQEAGWNQGGPLLAGSRTGNSCMF